MVDLKRGYRMLYGQRHPLARGRDRRVLRHRMVFFDAHAGDFWNEPETLTFECIWCGYTLPFVAPAECKPPHKYAVNVDHLNAIPGDDRPENLVASCFWCNSNRSWAEREAPDLWAQLQWDFRRVHPAERPNPLELIAAELGVEPETLRRPKVDA